MCLQRSLGEQLLEVVDANLRPRFQIFPAPEEFLFAEKSEVRDHRFTFLHGFGFEAEDVHDPQMDAADFGAVVVKKRDDSIFERRFDFHFFVHLALDASAISPFVPGEKRFVLVVHVTTDADRAFGDETLLAGFFSADVMEDAIAASKECVGNELLVGGIVFGRGASEKMIVSPGEEEVEVTLRLEAQTLKTAEFVEEFPPNDEDVLVRRGHLC